MSEETVPHYSNQSDQIHEISAALCKAQAQFTTVSRPPFR